MASGSSLTVVAGLTKAPAAGGLFAPAGRLSAACSWECRADLAGVLRLVPEGEADACEPLGPPLNGENVVVLEGRLHNGNVAPCLLYLHCDPHGSEEIIGLGIVSEARNMEVYVGDEYCGTGRGAKVFTGQHDSKNDQVSLYQKSLKLECSAASCKIKLLSIPGKQRVLVSKIIVQVKPVCMNPVPDIAALGSGIDLGKVQTIVESMGSKLSPGAQQLLDMVVFQQKNGLPFGGKLQNVFGKNGFGFENNHTIDGLKKVVDIGRLDHLPNGLSLPRAHAAAGMAMEELKRHADMNKQIPNAENVCETPGLQAPQPSAVLSQNDFKGLVSSFLQEQGSEKPNAHNSMLLLPLLQTVCGQVNQLRIDERNKHCENKSASEEDGIQTLGLEQQPVFLHMEKVIARNMDLMEKRLMDHIDLRMQKLQEHLDHKVAALFDLVQNSNNVSKEHGSEECSDGKR
ncbi:ATPase PAAT [Zootoca vivipara]|uniref:ATPase PAAT n=1 Tax=Zootoca vivipara TaxID=8524 RepID=UPI001590785A|nr:ATPase PAAT [Zootoca vivipara]